MCSYIDSTKKVTSCQSGNKNLNFQGQLVILGALLTFSSSFSIKCYFEFISSIFYKLAAELTGTELFFSSHSICIMYLCFPLLLSAKASHLVLNIYFLRLESDFYPFALWLSIFFELEAVCGFCCTAH